MYRLNLVSWSNKKVALTCKWLIHRCLNYIKMNEHVYVCVNRQEALSALLDKNNIIMKLYIFVKAVNNEILSLSMEFQLVLST